MNARGVRHMTERNMPGCICRCLVGDWPRPRPGAGMHLGTHLHGLQPGPGPPSTARCEAVGANMFFPSALASEEGVTSCRAYAVGCREQSQRTRPRWMHVALRVASCLGPCCLDTWYMTGMNVAVSTDSLQPTPTSPCVLHHEEPTAQMSKCEERSIL